MKTQEKHTLIFLPGQGEISKAIDKFENNKKKQANWHALPLYGALPPEEQNKIFEFDEAHKNEQNARMVVFCTNVAETSLTVPGVKLVIDSGYAKEAFYIVE